ncbi:hypothetical protein OS493_007278 [Desmophyllum pertusum]|uniref:Uncharacterized protein n=1 Tax=Desmophyllum pertusum TaxID=174260 RepID=A0A9X0CSN0_9CNID|nr:hypothetical protein OS493_007278 [Desmophyllum pertusum]
MGKNASKSPVISQSTTTAEGLKVNTVLLADNLLPSKFEDSKLVPCRANESAKNEAKQHRLIFVTGSTETIYAPGDIGLFSAVLAAYNNHWKLRTSPDDWWFCVIKRVASAIDNNAKKKSVRKMFVDHEGKKTIEVEVPDSTIYTVDYSWFFDQIAKGIQENVKVPEFVDGMTADFSTTTAVQKIVSQITLMYSVQEYFHYGMTTRCGIPAVEMLGIEDDWSKLKSKLKVLRTLLEPIENDLGLPSEWWDLVERVFRKLLATYQGKPDTEWWSHIMSYERAFRSVIKDPSGVQDTATLVAGMLGFTIHTDDTKEVSVQPFQGWSLVLSKDSPFVI